MSTSEEFASLPPPPAPARVQPGASAPPTRRAERLLPGGSEWTFELIERYDREIARIAQANKVHTLHNTPCSHIEARNNSLR